MKDWQKIRRSREDITQYCIHLTKNFDTLKKILKCGYLRPGFGKRRSITVGGKSNTIQGPYPAVCFTEQPLWCLAQTIKTLSRYRPYGIALRKKFLYNFGGRPVIYGDKNFLETLTDEHKYLWVKYDPNYESWGYPVDWTHEREWRCCGRKQTYIFDGRYNKRVSLNSEVVPILLPNDYEKILNRDHVPSFRVLVRSKKEVEELRDSDFLSLLSTTKVQNNMLLRRYFECLRKARIVAFEEVEKKLGEGEKAWRRFETIPNRSQ